MDTVANGLFVGTESDAENASVLRKHGVDVVVSLTHGDTDPGGNVTCVDVPMVDGPQNDPEVFVEAVRKVVERRESGRTVLIHCSAGASRSPAVAAAALTGLSDKSLNEAFSQVLRQRPTADPHDGLIRQAVNATEIFADCGQE